MSDLKWTWLRFCRKCESEFSQTLSHRGAMFSMTWWWTPHRTKGLGKFTRVRQGYDWKVWTTLAVKCCALNYLYGRLHNLAFMWKDLFALDVDWTHRFDEQVYDQITSESLQLKFFLTKWRVSSFSADTLWIFLWTKLLSTRTSSGILLSNAKPGGKPRSSLRRGEPPVAFVFRY